jgi:hypothetical protein
MSTLELKISKLFKIFYSSACTLTRQGQEIFLYSTASSNRLWGPPSLLSNVYRGKAAESWSWRLTI